MFDSWTSIPIIALVPLSLNNKKISKEFFRTLLLLLRKILEVCRNNIESTSTWYWLNITLRRNTKSLKTDKSLESGYTTIHCSNVNF